MSEVTSVNVFPLECGSNLVIPVDCPSMTYRRRARVCETGYETLSSLTEEQRALLDVSKDVMGRWQSLLAKRSAPQSNDDVYAQIEKLVKSGHEEWATPTISVSRKRDLDGIPIFEAGCGVGLVGVGRTERDALLHLKAEIRNGCVKALERTGPDVERLRRVLAEVPE